MTHRTRRWATVPAMLAATALALTACGTGGSGGNQNGGASAATDLRITWWGGDSENTAINAALDKYQEQKGVAVTREAVAWDGYWDKLATTTANKGAPDVVMQAGSQIPTYAANGALVDLNSITTLDMSKIDEGLRQFGVVGDANYGVVAAANAMGIAANEDLLKEAGVTLPDGPFSWDDLAQAATKVHTAKPDVYGLQDAGGDLISMILYVRQDGRDFYKDDGTLNASKDDVANWLQYWEDLRKSGVAPPADVTAEAAGGGITVTPIAKGHAAMTLAWTQDYVALTKAADLPFSLNLVPFEADHPSLWMNAASLWSISTSSKTPDEAAELINFLISDTEAINALGLSLGMPPSQAARDLISDKMTPAEKTASDYMDKVSETQRPLNRLWPASFAPLRSKMGELNEAVAFGQMSVDEAADAFMAEYEANIG